MTDDFMIPEEAVEAAAALVWEEVWSEAESFADAGAGTKRECRVSARNILRAALPHLRAHQIEGAGGVAEAREALIREFSGLIDVDACVPDMPSWLRAFGERLLGLPILTPEEVEAETKALAETATKLGYELGRKEALADLRVVTSGVSYFALAFGPLYHTRESAAEALMKLRRPS